MAIIIIVVSIFKMWFWHFDISYYIGMNNEHAWCKLQGRMYFKLLLFGQIKR